MEIKRKLLKYVYPLMIKWSKLSGKWRQIETSDVRAPQSAFTLEALDIHGKKISFSSFEGRKILVVNTASFCVYTDQYTLLQRLYTECQEQIVIIGFPSGDFRDQEYADDQAIDALCVSYDISFPVMQKSVVKKNEDQHEVFQWLTHSEKNGWNEREPFWNFSKYLIDEMGDLIAVFGPSVEPEEIKAYL